MSKTQLSSSASIQHGNKGPQQPQLHSKLRWMSSLEKRQQSAFQLHINVAPAKVKTATEHALMFRSIKAWRNRKNNFCTVCRSVQQQQKHNTTQNKKTSSYCIPQRLKLSFTKLVNNNNTKQTRTRDGSKNKTKQKAYSLLLVSGAEANGTAMHPLASRLFCFQSVLQWQGLVSFVQIIKVTRGADKNKGRWQHALMTLQLEGAWERLHSWGRFEQHRATPSQTKQMENNIRRLVHTVLAFERLRQEHQKCKVTLDYTRPISKK